MKTNNAYFPDVTTENPKIIRFISRLVKQGHIQFNAPCNNRYAELERLSADMAVLHKFCNGEFIEIDKLHTELKSAVIGLQIQQPKDVALSKANEMLAKKERESPNILDEIEKAKKEGHFKDYTDVKGRIADGATYAEVMPDLPSFYQEADHKAKEVKAYIKPKTWSYVTFAIQIEGLFKFFFHVRR